MCIRDSSTSDDGADRGRRRAVQVQVCAMSNISRIAGPYERSEPCEESGHALLHSNGCAGAARSRSSSGSLGRRSCRHLLSPTPCYSDEQMSEQRSSEWLSIETMRPPSETEVWLYAKIDGAEITKKGRISKTKPGEPVLYQWDDTRGAPTHWKPIL